MPFTAHDLAWQYHDENPQQQFAYSADGATVGMWYANYGEFRAMASLTITGHWYAAPHVLVNEQQLVRQWIPCGAAPTPTHEELYNMSSYTARATWENGSYAEKTFTWYDDMLAWLAQYPEAGIIAYDNLTEEAVDQRRLAEDVCAVMAANA